jgi:hypothetical protein
MCCFHHQGHDDGGSTYLWNVGKQLFYTAVHPRRQIWTWLVCCLYRYVTLKYLQWYFVTYVLHTSFFSRYHVGSVPNGNLKEPVYSLKEKQGHTSRKIGKDKGISVYIYIYIYIYIYK